MLHVEVMDSFGRVKRTPASKLASGELDVGGERFVEHASFGTIISYRRAELDVDACPTNFVNIAMPFPMGRYVYPAPVVWVCVDGTSIEKLWKSPEKSGGCVKHIEVSEISDDEEARSVNEEDDDELSANEELSDRMSEGEPVTDTSLDTDPEYVA